MYTHTPKRSMLLVAALSCCLIAANAVLADGPSDKSRISIVNCNQGGFSVQSAIDEAKYGRDTTIFIVGFCDERVDIVKDGITLSGNRDGYDTIGGGLTEVKVTGAQRVRIEYLDITGAGNGVIVREGASVTISNNNIHDNEASGVNAYYQAFARVESNTITGNGNYGGIEGWTGATIMSTGNVITNNAYAAIEMGNMSVFKSGRHTGSSDPADGDVIVQIGCARGDTAAECADKVDPYAETYALECYRNCLTDMRNGNITGLILVGGMSNFETRTGSINGNIEGWDSRLRLRDTVKSGLVSCNDATNALYGNPCGTSYPSSP
jgi:parallel beta-helix repeat protein